MIPLHSRLGRSELPLIRHIALAMSITLAMAMTAVAQSAAPRTALDDAASRIASGRVLMATAWGGIPNANDLIAAVVEREDRNSRNPPHDFVVVFRRTSSGILDVERGIELDPTFQATGFATMDVRGEGRPDLLVFGRATSTNTSSVAVIDYDVATGATRLLMAESSALDGSTSETEVRRRLPLSNGVVSDQIGTTTSERSILGRVRFSSPAQIRALVATAGLEICDVQAPSIGRRTRTCRRYAGSRASDALVMGEVRSRLDSLFGSSGGWGTFTCTTGPNARCEDLPIRGSATRSNSPEPVRAVESRASPRPIRCSENEPIRPERT